MSTAGLMGEGLSSEQSCKKQFFFIIGWWFLCLAPWVFLSQTEVNTKPFSLLLDIMNCVLTIMCSKWAIFCISKNKIPLPLEEAKTAWGEAAFMKHFIKLFYLYFLFSQIFIISQNCCKSAETTAISRILGFCSDIYTLYKIKQVKKD